MSQNEMRLFRIILATLIFCAVFPQLALADRSPAMINRAAISIAKPSKIFYGTDGQEISPEMVATYNQFKHDVLDFDVAKIIPTNMTPTTSSGAVFSKIADKGASYLMKTDEFRHSILGRATTEVEQTMKQEVSLGEAEPGGVEHKLNFNVQAFQAIAQVNYTGLMNCALKYKATISTLAFEVSEKIYEDKDLVVSQNFGPAPVSEVSIRWDW